jgi:transposase
MVDIELIHKRRHLDGWSVRKISRETGWSRQAVRKALETSEPPRYRLKEPKAKPVMDPYKAVIATWLAADEEAPPKQRHTAKRVYDRLVAEHGFTGGASTVRQYLAGVRGRRVEAFVPLAAGAGQQAQVDWGQATVRMGDEEVPAHLFCLRLRHSGAPFVWAAPTERLEAFLEGHVRAFAWLGGVPRECLYDNLKTAVVRILAGPEREEGKVFSSLRTHYLFESLFCRPAQGHEKGAVENLVGYVRRNALVPVPEVASWEDLNARLLAWCEAERTRHAEAFAAEQAALRPLPAHSFAAEVVRPAVVDRTGLVQVETRRYSVPSQHVGQKVEVHLSTSRVEVYRQGERLASHARHYGRGAPVLQLEHYLPVLAKKPHAVSHAAIITDLPAVYAAVRDKLCHARTDGYREFAAILLLHAEFPGSAVTAALEEAVARGSVQASVVRQLVLNATSPATPPPLAVPDSLAGLLVGAPDLSRYDTLAVGA